MPSPACRMPLQRLPDARDRRADGRLRVRRARRRQDLPGQRVHRVQGVARAGGRAVAAARHVEHRRRRRRPLVREEVRHLQELVVLRLLVREAHAVVERQPAVHLPVVLDVELGVVVDHAAFDRASSCCRYCVKTPDRGVGVAEAGVERVVGVVAEVDRALELSSPRRRRRCSAPCSCGCCRSPP